MHETYSLESVYKKNTGAPVMSKDATDATPAELVTRIRDGDREAEASLCQRYRESVRRLILRLCRDESRAERCEGHGGDE